MHIRNLFPRNTRIVEILSAYVLILFSAVLLVSSFKNASIANHVYAAFLFGIGFFQLISIIWSSSMRYLRCVISWFAGVLWLWIGTSSLSVNQVISVGDLLCIILGTSNFYAFIIKTLSLCRDIQSNNQDGKQQKWMAQK